MLSRTRPTGLAEEQSRRPTGGTSERSKGASNSRAAPGRVFPSLLCLAISSPASSEQQPDACERRLAARALSLSLSHTHPPSHTHRGEGKGSRGLVCYWVEGNQSASLSHKAPRPFIQPPHAGSRSFPAVRRLGRQPVCGGHSGAACSLWLLPFLAAVQRLMGLPLRRRLGA